MQVANVNSDLAVILEDHLLRLQEWLEARFKTQEEVLREIIGKGCVQEATAFSHGAATFLDVSPRNHLLQVSSEYQKTGLLNGKLRLTGASGDVAVQDVDAEANAQRVTLPGVTSTAESPTEAPMAMLDRMASNEDDLATTAKFKKKNSRSTTFQIHEQELATKLMAVFDELDLDHSGTLDLIELKEAFEEVGLPRVRAFEAFALTDTSDNAVIDRMEWLRMIDEAAQIDDDEEINLLTDFLTRLQRRERHLGRIYEKGKRNRRLCIIRHDGSFRMSWDIGMMLLLFYISMFLPASLGFGQSAALDRVDTVLDLVFCCDCLLNFRTSFLDRDEVPIFDGKQIALRYLRSWFLLDFVSSVPFDLLTTGILPSLTAVRLLKVGKIAKVLKLLRISKVAKVLSDSDFMDRLEERTLTRSHQTCMRVAKLGFFVFVLCHWLACFGSALDGGSIDSYFVGASQSPTGIQKYLAAMYWSMTTLSTVGYGDILPTSDLERAYAMLAMVVGGAFYGYIVGNITSIISDVDLNSRAYNTRMDLVKSWFDIHETIPKQLRRRILKHYKVTLHAKTAIDDAAIVSELSPELRAELAFFLININVRHNPMFNDLSNSALSNIVELLQRSQSNKEEQIVTLGDPGLAMYIIIEGAARFNEGIPWMPNNPEPDAVAPAGLGSSKSFGTPKSARYRFHQLTAGNSFGEEIIFGLEETYQYTIVAIDLCSYNFITERGFKYHLLSLPDLREKMLVGFLNGKNSSKNDLQRMGSAGSSVVKHKERISFATKAFQVLS